MKIPQMFLIFISLFKFLKCEIVVDVKVLDSNKNALSPEQIENTRFLTVEFWRGGEAMYSFDLGRDISIVSPDFEAYEQDKEGNPVRLEDENIKKNCYFSGTVGGFQESMVAMTFCHGIMGYFIAGENSYQVNQVILDSTPSFSHATLHKQKASNLTFECGVKTVPTKHKDKKIYKRAMADMGNEIKVIELYLIANKDVFLSFGTVDNTIKNIKILVLLANLYYRQANFFLVAKTIDVWSDHDKFATSSDGVGFDIIARFKSYKKQNFNHVDHDAAFLFISEMKTPVIGYAEFNSVCQLDQNVAWMVLDRNYDNMAITLTLTHELGHLLGLSHENTCIPRPAVHNIMKPHYGAINEFMYAWSACTLRKLEEIHVSPKSFCLLPYREYTNGECGDGKVNEGEECDNFGMLDRAKKKCCDPRTCKLIGDAKCWRGLCCDVNTCQFKGAGTVCRDKDGLCDEDDVCSGSSGVCRNKFKRNGVKCSYKAFCFKGKCRSRDMACENFYGIQNGQSHDICYTYDAHWIPRSLIYLNCGLDPNKNPIICERRDRTCGKLLCQFNDYVNLLILKNTLTI